MMPTKEMMFRSFLSGYINQNVLDECWIKQSPYSTIKELHEFRAIETLEAHGMNHKISETVVSIIPKIERPVSHLLLMFAFFKAIFAKLFTQRIALKNKIVTLQLNFQERRFKELLKSGEITDGLVVVKIPGQISKYRKTEVVSVFSGISWRQMLLSFFYSWQFVCFVQNKYGKKDSLFRSYSSFEYFLAFFYFSNLDESNTLTYVDTIARWAYIYEKMPHKKIWVQHGKLDDSTYFIKINNVDIAYYINERQKDICEKYLFGNSPVAKYRKLFEYSGQEKMKNNGNKEVLIICHSFFDAYQKQVLSSTYGKGVNIYMKPHPEDRIEVYQELQKQYPELEILGKYDFPKVDYVISYDSTLADEYEMHDIEVIKYEAQDYKDKLKSIIE